MLPVNFTIHGRTRIAGYDASDFGFRRRTDSGGNRNLSGHHPVHADRPVGEWKPIWRFFGADEPNYATCRTGGNCSANSARWRPNEVYFRAHNLLTSGDGTPALKWGSTGAYTEDQQGNPVYNWTILDRIFDTYRDHGVRPYVEIGFMPEALSTNPEPYQHHWTPKAKYNEIFSPAGLIRRRITRNGRNWFTNGRSTTWNDTGSAEVRNWYWETWNEANIGYWQGTPRGIFPAAR